MTVTGETITQTEPELSQPWRDVPGTALTDVDMYDEEGLLLVAEENVTDHRTWDLAELMTSNAVVQAAPADHVSDQPRRLTDRGMDISWQERARCVGTDPEAYFPEQGASSWLAKRVCAACEVRAECLEYALAEGIEYGTWGGLSGRQIKAYKRAIRRAEATAP